MLGFSEDRRPQAYFDSNRNAEGRSARSFYGDKNLLV